MEKLIIKQIEEALSSHYEEWDNDGVLEGVCSCGTNLRIQDNAHHIAEQIISQLDDNGFRIATKL